MLGLSNLLLRLIKITRSKLKLCNKYKTKWDISQT
jgi:hypothetical protein